MCTRYGINAFANPFAMLLASLDGQNNNKVFFRNASVIVTTAAYFSQYSRTSMRDHLS